MSRNANLTNRQMALLLTVGLDPEPHTTLSLASRLGVARSVILSGLERLGSLSYIERITHSGHRAIVVRITGQGRLYLDEFADDIQHTKLH